ncbi:hypothetical protein MJN85_29700, partial [Salmonella enterica subsp. enterica serovar Anatum]|nr:hypothetical protein [Salmonella enterica subsp. enterica serovar Anatum]
YATTLPDIPEPLKNGTGAIDNNGVIYVGLGTAGTSWYKIDLKTDAKEAAIAPRLLLDGKPLSFNSPHWRVSPWHLMTGDPATITT